MREENYDDGDAIDLIEQDLAELQRLRGEMRALMERAERSESRAGFKFHHYGPNFEKFYILKDE